MVRGWGLLAELSWPGLWEDCLFWPHLKTTLEPVLIAIEPQTNERQSGIFRSAGHRDYPHSHSDPGCAGGF